MGFPRYFLELCWCPLRRSPVIRYFVIPNPSYQQSYVYSVVYMASHDPSTYRFSNLTYVLMYSTLLTAYYMSVPHESIYFSQLTRFVQFRYRNGPEE